MTINEIAREWLNDKNFEGWLYGDVVRSFCQHLSSKYQLVPKEEKPQEVDCCQGRADHYERVHQLQEVKECSEKLVCDKCKTDWRGGVCPCVCHKPKEKVKEIKEGTTGVCDGEWYQYSAVERCPHDKHGKGVIKENPQPRQRIELLKRRESGFGADGYAIVDMPKKINELVNAWNANLKE